MMRLIKYFLAVIVVLALACMPALADTIFTVTGNIGGTGSVNAEAIFHITGTTLTVTLENLEGVGSTANLGQLVTGLIFTGSGFSGVTLAGAQAAGTVDCVFKGNCTVTTGTVTDNSGYFGWAEKASGGGYLLGAGDFTWKPNAVFFDSATGTFPTTDGLGNSEHNPYLLGPVAFTFDLTGVTGPISINSATFNFGTTPNSLTGESVPTVPEPASLALFGSGLIGLGTIVRRQHFERS